MNTHSKSWPRRHKILTAIIGFFGLTFAIGIGAAASSPSSPHKPEIAATAYLPAAIASATQYMATPDTTPQAPHTVTYVVTGTPGDADVTYGPTGSQFRGTDPMNLTRPIESVLYYSIDAQMNGDVNGHVSCAIEVDGVVISHATAYGSYNIASCEISQDPLSGNWTDTNSG